MLRLFVAVDLPEDISVLICGMGASIPGGRPVAPEQLHLTLKFIGDVESGMLPDIKTALHTISHPPFPLAIKGIGHFPPRGTPKVVWAGVSPVDKLTELRNKVERALYGAGIPKERRKFAPHITLARLKNSPIKRVSRFLAENSLLETPPFTISAMHLYSSTLSSSGAVHTMLDTIELELSAP